MISGYNRRNACRTNGTEYVLTVPVGLAIALVSAEACMVLVVLGMLVRLKYKCGIPQKINYMARA